MNIYTLKPGDTVTGLYAHVPFWGKISQIRLHTINRNMCMVIKLDKSITIFETSIRTDVYLEVNSEGVQCAGFSIDGAIQYGGYTMANRLEAADNTRAYCVKLYTEMEQQSAERVEVMRELRVATIKRLDERRIMRACWLLARHYKSLIA